MTNLELCGLTVNRLKNWRELLSYLFISVENISKQQLPSPLGHLNFAKHVILQRHSFVSGFWNWLPLFQTEQNCSERRSLLPFKPLVYAGKSVEWHLHCYDDIVCFSDSVFHWCGSIVFFPRPVVCQLVGLFFLTLESMLYEIYPIAETYSVWVHYWQRKGIAMMWYNE